MTVSVLGRQNESQQSLTLKDLINCVGALDIREPQTFVLPVILFQKIRTLMGRLEDVENQPEDIQKEEWTSLEERVILTKKHTHPAFRHQQVIFGEKTDNRHHPVTSVHGKKNWLRCM